MRKHMRKTLGLLDKPCRELRRSSGAAADEPVDAPGLIFRQS